MTRERVRDRPLRLRRCREENRIDLGHSGKIGRCGKIGIERDAGQISRVGVLAIDLIRDGGVTRPEQHAAPGHACNLGKCGAPGSATDHANALDSLAHVSCSLPP